jgi:integrase
MSEIRELLIAVWEIEPLLLVETFAGIRPEEAVRLGWHDISLPRAKVTLRADNTKTGGAREIELAPSALAWFELYLASGYPHPGSLLPFSISTHHRFEPDCRL